METLEESKKYTEYLLKRGYFFNRSESLQALERVQSLYFHEEMQLCMKLAILKGRLSKRGIVKIPSYLSTDRIPVLVKYHNTFNMAIYHQFKEAKEMHNLYKAYLRFSFFPTQSPWNI